MTRELVQKLKPYVSTFSAAIPTQYKHGDVITVGGVVTDILNMMDLLSSAHKQEDRTEGVYLTLDDGIGLNQIAIAPKAFDVYIKNNGMIKIGDTLIAEGRLFRLDTTHTFEGPRGKKMTVDKHTEETVRVLAYQIALLPEDKPKKQLEETIE